MLNILWEGNLLPLSMILTYDAELFMVVTNFQLRKWPCYYMLCMVSADKIVCFQLLSCDFRALCAYLVVLVGSLQQKGIKTLLLSGDREEAVAATAKEVGIGKEYINSSLTPQQKSEVISTLQTSGHHVAMVLILLFLIAFHINIDKLIWTYLFSLVVHLIFLSDDAFNLYPAGFFLWESESFIILMETLF